MKTRTASVLTSALLCLSSNWLLSQETPAQRHAMATNQLKRIASEMSARCLNDVATLDDWKKQRPELRRQLLEMLGLDPLPARTPLKPRVSGQLDRGRYRIENLIFQSLPGLYVTANFYVPKAAPKPLPTILYLCGHSPHPAGAKTEYQDRAIWFASHGYACLVLDTLEFGEVAGIHHGTHNLNMWHWLSLGYTPAGVEVWNAMRAIDYLESRREVDPRRIGLTGISGGGAMTWYTAAVDERITVAAPVCSTFTFGSQAAHWLASGQCDCIYYHNTYQWDFPVVGALIAPRPLLMISGQKDTIFPPDGYHAVFQRTKKIYDLYAAANSDRISELDDNVGHSDPPLFLNGARQWMQRWLKEDSSALPDDSTAETKAKPEDLTCLPRLPDDAVNYRIQHEFVPHVSARDRTSGRARAQRRSDLVAELTNKVFRWFPTHKVPFTTQVLRTSAGYLSKYADYKEVSFQSEEGVRIRAQVLTPRERSAAPLLIYVKRPGDSVYFMDTDELLPVLGRYTVMILSPRFTEQSISAVEYTDVERTAAWLGRTMASMQVWDILRAVDWASEEVRAGNVSVYGKGEMGILALYAGLFDERIQQIVLNDPPVSHWQGPALLNVLRVTDISEVAGAFAPRRLVSLTPFPAAFEPGRTAYKRAGAKKQFLEAGSLPEALEVWKYSAHSER